mgnify:FL=1
MLGVLSAPDALVVAALVTVSLPSVFGAWNSYHAKKSSRAVNDAVNNRPAGDPTLYEMVSRLDLKVDKHLDWHRNESEAGARAAGDAGGA